MLDLYKYFIKSNYIHTVEFVNVKCKRKFEGGCLDWNTRLLEKHVGTFNLEDCYGLCYKYTGCYGFFLHKDGKKCQLYKEGCERNIQDPPRWDYYEMKECSGIF